MEKRLYFLIFSMLIYTTVFAQDKKKEKNPDERIIVNKKYDEKGNLSEYDSTYFHQWSSDSLFDLGSPDKFFAEKGFTDSKDLLKHFFNDSLFSQMPGFKDFGFSFSEKDFFGDSFKHFFNDSVFGQNKDFFFDPKGKEKWNFMFPESEELEDYQRFDDPEQEKEWNELMQRHQQELLDFQRKWEKKKKGKVN